MLFEEIIGQTEIKNRLLKSVQEGRVPHAQLFYGNEGVGKMPLALAYAQYISCTNRTEKDSCGICPSCVKFQKKIHPDLHFVFPFAKGENKGKEKCDDFLPEWREFTAKNTYFGLPDWMNFLNLGNKQATIYANESTEILRKLSLKTYESDYKIMIIWLPERMHISCSNKLLKILEEPPTKTIFLLVSEQPEKIISTIISRTQSINIPNIDNQSVCDALIEKYKVSQKNAADISRISNGNFVRALNIINTSQETQNNFINYREMMLLAYARNVSGAKKWAEEIGASTNGREKQKSFLQYAQHITRECFIKRIHNDDLNYLIDYESDFSDKFSRFVDEDNIENLMNYFADAESDIEQNVQAKFVFFDLCLKLMAQIKK